MKGSLYFSKSWMVVAGSLWDSRVVRITGAPTQPSQLVPLAPLLTSPKLLIEVAGSSFGLEGLKLN